MSGNSEYVTNKAPDLSSLGRVKDHLYYREDESQLTEIESQSNIGRYRKSFSSKAHGSTGDILLPNLDGVEQCYVHLQLPPLTAQQVLCHGWGWYALGQLNIQLGSSNISLSQKSGHSNLSEFWYSVETKEKRDEILLLGGASKAKGAVSTGPHDAIILLNLPFSSLKDNINKRSFDASTLSSPILIQCTWAPTFNYLSLTQSAMQADYDAVPSSFTIADLIVRQDILTDKSMSLKNTLLRTDVFSVYPYTHVLTGTQRTETLTVTNNRAPFELTLSGFLNSDLLGFFFTIIPTLTLTGVHKAIGDVAMNRPSNPLSTLQVRDITVLYNGSTLMDLPAHTAELHMMSLMKGSPYAHNIKLDAMGAVEAPMVAGLSYQYYISFTSKLRTQFTDRMANVPRYSQQPMEIKFTIEDPVNATGQIAYTFRSSFVYNSVALMSKGNSNIFFT